VYRLGQNEDLRRRLGAEFSVPKTSILKACKNAVFPMCFGYVCRLAKTGGVRLDSAHRIRLRVFADACGLFQRLRRVCEELAAMKDNSKVQALAMRAVDAAKACGVSERTFADWLKSDNPPPHFKRGGCVLVPTRELSEWLSGQITNGGNT
jgi:hypothetical protein